jgi:flagella basal body P-ring formation protein FlgA
MRQNSSKPNLPFLRRVGASFAGLVLALAGWGCGQGALEAAEISLRKQCEVDGPIVTIADVAVVIADGRDEVERIGAIELFPTPAAGRPRVLHVQEIRDLLILRGVDLLDHRFSGASQVTIQSGGQGHAREPGPMLASTTRRIRRELSEAIAAYLDTQAGNQGAWDVAVQADEEQLRVLHEVQGPYRIAGGKSPWVGRQRFQVNVEGRPQGSLTVYAEVSLPPSIVVAVRAIPRGALIRAGDVQLQPGGRNIGADEALSSLDEAVGCEATQGIAAGKILTHDAVRAPLMVRRGEVVTVYVRSPAIEIRTTGRVRDDGSMGELVAVESLLNRKRYFARVCGVQEVEVYGRAKQTAAEPAVGARPSEAVAGSATPVPTPKPVAQPVSTPRAASYQPRGRTPAAGHSSSQEIAGFSMFRTGGSQ